MKTLFWVLCAILMCAQAVPAQDVATRLAGMSKDYQDAVGWNKLTAEEKRSWSVLISKWLQASPPPNASSPPKMGRHWIMSATASPKGVRLKLEDEGVFEIALAPLDVQFSGWAELAEFLKVYRDITLVPSDSPSYPCRIFGVNPRAGHAGEMPLQPLAFKGNILYLRVAADN